MKSESYLMENVAQTDNYLRTNGNDYGTTLIEGPFFQLRQLIHFDI